MKHQVQILPSAESFYNDFQSALSWWIETPTSHQTLKPISTTKKEITLSRTYFPELSIPQIYSHQIDQIRYAARNRLCVEMQYHESIRLIEPYSIRLTHTDNTLLYAYELTSEYSKSDSIKAYKVSEIINIKITQEVFQPRHMIEL